MDEKTRRIAIEKANAMGFNIGYPDELTDDNKLEVYYRELEVQPDSLLHSVLRARIFAKDKKIRDFRKPILKNDWRVIATRVTEVDAFYYPSMNSICKFCNKSNIHKRITCRIFFFSLVYSNVGWYSTGSFIQSNSVNY